MTRNTHVAYWKDQSLLVNLFTASAVPKAIASIFIAVHAGRNFKVITTW